MPDNTIKARKPKQHTRKETSLTPGFCSPPPPLIAAEQLTGAQVAAPIRLQGGAGESWRNNRTNQAGWEGRCTEICLGWKESGQWKPTNPCPEVTQNTKPAKQIHRDKGGRSRRSKNSFVALFFSYSFLNDFCIFICHLKFGQLDLAYSRCQRPIKTYICVVLLLAPF